MQFKILIYLLYHPKKIGVSSQRIPHCGFLPGTHLNALNLGDKKKEKKDVFILFL